MLFFISLSAFAIRFQPYSFYPIQFDAIVTSEDFRDASALQCFVDSVPSGSVIGFRGGVYTGESLVLRQPITLAAIKGDSPVVFVHNAAFGHQTACLIVSADDEAYSTSLWGIHFSSRIDGDAYGMELGHALSLVRGACLAVDCSFRSYAGSSIRIHKVDDPAFLHMKYCDISSGYRNGIMVEGGQGLYLDGCFIACNQGHGVFLESGAAISAARSTISHNGGMGIAGVVQDICIVQSFVEHNERACPLESGWPELPEQAQESVD